MSASQSTTSEDRSRILDAMHAFERVEAVIALHAVPLDDEGLVVGARIAFSPTADVEELARWIDALARHVRRSVPAALAVYIEPDIVVARPDVAPSTDHIVIQSGN